MKQIISSVLLLATCLFSFGQARFVNPIEGAYGQDFIIVNYVDWGSGSDVLDNHCLSKSYDGHQGTDFVLKSFRQMDEGVNVLAVDSGVVIFTHDGEFDREKVSVISKGLGNYIGITHSGDLQTYYGHLKKNSILVEEGDSVYPGQVIAQVASSGNSTDPHLHFELWYDSAYYIDPFQGPCGNSSTYWIDPIPYDSSFNVWTSSTWTEIPSLDTLREAPLLIDTFDSTDSHLTYWALLYGLRQGDSLMVEWIDPEGLQASMGVYELAYDWWYYYYYSYIEFQLSMPFGEWTINLYRNNDLIDTRYMYYIDPAQDTTNGKQHVRDVSDQVWQHNNLIYNKLTSPMPYTLISSQGALIKTGVMNPNEVIDLSDLSAGVYLISCGTKEEQQLVKKVLVQ